MKTAKTYTIVVLYMQSGRVNQSEFQTILQ